MDVAVDGRDSEGSARGTYAGRRSGVVAGHPDPCRLGAAHVCPLELEGRRQELSCVLQNG